MASISDFFIDSDETNESEKLVMQLVIDVTYDTPYAADSLDAMERNLVAIAERAANDGMLSGYGEETVDSYNYMVHTQNVVEPPSDEAMAQFFMSKLTEQIHRTGETPIQDIAMLMVKFGKQNPIAFINEVVSGMGDQKERDREYDPDRDRRDQEQRPKP